MKMTKQLNQMKICLVLVACDCDPCCDFMEAPCRSFPVSTKTLC